MMGHVMRITIGLSCMLFVGFLYAAHESDVMAGVVLPEWRPFVGAVDEEGDGEDASQEDDSVGEDMQALKLENAHLKTLLGCEQAGVASCSAALGREQEGTTFLRTALSIYAKICTEQHSQIERLLELNQIQNKILLELSETVCRDHGQEEGKRSQTSNAPRRPKRRRKR